MSGNETLNEIFSHLAEAVSITDAMAERAEASYRAVGKHLDDDGSLGETDVYVQGSFALGTVNRPPSGEDDGYDIDLVCNLTEAAWQTAEYVKKSVGKSLEDYRKEAEPEGKRCWTFQYSGFHMDVLPCTPDVRHSVAPEAIRLTHRNPDVTYSDRYSNPKGYRKWFLSMAGEPRSARRSAAASRQFCDVGDVPEYAVKAPLQQAVQILKHHRNMMFQDREDAPISIIITTLAARAYRGEEGVFDAVAGILARMDMYVERSAGGYLIENPVDEYENFADKWNEQPVKAAAFFEWLRQARADLSSAPMSMVGIDRLGEHLSECMGSRQSGEALRAYGESRRIKREAGALFASSAGVSAVATPGAKPIPSHSFFGRG